MICAPRERRFARWINAIRAMIPPSPSLSARMMNVTYLTLTISVIDQKISETTPKTSSWPGWSPCSGANTVRSV